MPFLCLAVRRLAIWARFSGDVYRASFRSAARSRSSISGALPGAAVRSLSGRRLSAGQVHLLALLVTGIAALVRKAREIRRDANSVGFVRPEPMAKWPRPWLGVWCLGSQAPMLLGPEVVKVPEREKKAKLHCVVGAEYIQGGAQPAVKWEIKSAPGYSVVNRRLGGARFAGCRLPLKTKLTLVCWLCWLGAGCLCQTVGTWRCDEAQGRSQRAIQLVLVIN